uniref:Uncharacterized protein n=1 Tax=Ditylenchus dipsaci TaxID=166011 RepID=A0A915E553_9BILA
MYAVGFKMSASKTGRGGPMEKKQLFEQVQILYNESSSLEGFFSGIETSLAGSDCLNTPSPKRAAKSISFTSLVVKRQNKESSVEELQREALLGQIAVKNKFSSVLNQIADIMSSNFGSQGKKEEKKYKDFSG